MTNKNYVSGSNFEYRVIKYLKEKLSFDYAQRTAGSHSLIDIWAFSVLREQVWALQLKKREKQHDKHKSAQLGVYAGMCGFRAFEAWREDKRPYTLKFKEITYAPFPLETNNPYLTKTGNK